MELQAVAWCERAREVENTIETIVVPKVDVRIGQRWEQLAATIIWSRGRGVVQNFVPRDVWIAN